MKLILFFNGWGMDKKVVEDVSIPKGYELEVVNFPYDVDIDLKKYEEIILVGWSFGCYYLTKWVLLNKGMECVKKIVAINGNGEVIGKFGITPKIFDFTLETLTPESLLKFYKNMGIDESFKIPKRDFEGVRSELQFFKDNYLPLENIFDEVVIGKGDKIVPASRQKKYCEEKNISYRELEMGHYPFDIIKSWSELI